MGKSKTNKFKRPRINAVGLPANAVQELNVEEEPNGEESCPAGELLEKVGMSSNNVFVVLITHRIIVMIVELIQTFTVVLALPFTQHNFKIVTCQFNGFIY